MGPLNFELCCTYRSQNVLSLKATTKHPKADERGPTRSYGWYLLELSVGRFLITRYPHKLDGTSPAQQRLCSTLYCVTKKTKRLYKLYITMLIWRNDKTPSGWGGPGWLAAKAVILQFIILIGTIIMIVCRSTQPSRCYCIHSKCI